MDKYKFFINIFLLIIVLFAIYNIFLFDFILRKNIILKIIDIFLIGSMILTLFSIFLKKEWEMERWILIFGLMRLITIYFYYWL